jgi:hypothetical protein
MTQLNSLARSSGLGRLKQRATKSVAFNASQAPKRIPKNDTIHVPEVSPPQATKYLCTLHLPTIGHHGKVTGTKPNWFADPPRSSIAGEPCATASVESGLLWWIFAQNPRLVAAVIQRGD